MKKRKIGDVEGKYYDDFLIHKRSIETTKIVDFVSMTKDPKIYIARVEVVTIDPDLNQMARKRITNPQDQASQTYISEASTFE